MVNRFFKEYFSIIFIITTFMGVFHHHDDLQQHNDCKICMLQSSIANADTPVDVFSLTQLHIYPESIVTQFANFYTRKKVTSLYARAPPKIS